MSTAVLMALYIVVHGPSTDDMVDDVVGDAMDAAVCSISTHVPVLAESGICGSIVVFAVPRGGILVAWDAETTGEYGVLVLVSPSTT